MFGAPRRVPKARGGDARRKISEGPGKALEAGGASRKAPPGRGAESSGAAGARRGGIKQRRGCGGSRHPRARSRHCPMYTRLPPSAAAPRLRASQQNQAAAIPGQPRHRLGSPPPRRMNCCSLADSVCGPPPRAARSAAAGGSGAGEMSPPQQVAVAPAGGGPAAAALAGGQATSCVHCPKAMVGRVIGKGGETIKALQQYTGAMIQIDQSVDPTRVTIAGNPQSMGLAVSMVQDIVAGNFKGFAMLRQMGQGGSEKAAAVSEAVAQPQPVYIEGYGFVPPSQFYDPEEMANAMVLNLRAVNPGSKLFGKVGSGMPSPTAAGTAQLSAEAHASDASQALINLSVLNALAAQSNSQLLGGQSSAGSPMLGQLNLNTSSAASPLLSGVGGSSPALLSAAAGGGMCSLLGGGAGGATVMGTGAGLQGYPMFGGQGLLPGKTGLVPESPRGSPLVTPSSSGHSHLMSNIRELSQFRATASPLQSPMDSGQPLGQSLGSLGSPLGSNTSVTSSLFNSALGAQPLQSGGWMQMSDPEGRPFFLNLQTRKAQWEPPGG